MSDNGSSIIDLAMMIDRWRAIPGQAWMKAIAAYGEHVVKAYESSTSRVNAPDYLSSFLHEMHMNETLVDHIPVLLAQLALAASPPSSGRRGRWRRPP